MEKLPHFHPVKKTGRYKFMRRIPTKLQGLIGPEKGIWDYSLGSDYAKAVARCAT